MKPGPKPYWPDRKWMKYWIAKRQNAFKEGISFSLTRDECLELSENCLVRPSFGGVHLGRIDHDKGYETGNVEWQDATENRRDAYDRNSRNRPRDDKGKWI